MIKWPLIWNTARSAAGGNVERRLVKAETFLNSYEDVNDSPFADLDPASDAYDMRVRSAAAFLMATPRFKEH